MNTKKDLWEKEITETVILDRQKFWEKLSDGEGLQEKKGCNGVRWSDESKKAHSERIKAFWW